MSIIAMILLLAGIGAWRFLHESNAALVRQIERLQSEKTNDLRMVWYEQEVLRHRLVTWGYPVKKFFDMPNTRMNTTWSKEHWDAMIKFRDKECSSLANFGMGPADGSGTVLYVTVTNLPTHVPQWKAMLLKWDSGAEETRALQKDGPETIPTN